MKHIVIILLLMVQASSVLGSQIEAPNPVEIAKSAMHIFVGRVVSTQEVLAPSKQCSQFHYDANIDVLENIRGVAKGPIVLPVCIGIKGFNVKLESGVYLFFLNKKDGTYERVYPAGGIIKFD